MMKAACHCGSVSFEVSLPEGIKGAYRCNCSLCFRKGTIVVPVPRQALRMIAGADVLASYQFNTKTARHFFCKTCGIHTHHQRRTDSNSFGVNVACLNGVRLEDLAEIALLDGRDNHPSDRK